MWLGDGNLRPDAAPPADAAPPPANELGFGAPRLLDAISTPDTIDDDPSLTADRTLLYFNSKRDGGAGAEDIWFARRADAAARWSSPQAVAELNTGHRETGIALSDDGLSIWWSSDRPGGAGGLDVYTARRDGLAAPWSEVGRVAELSSAGDDLISRVTPGERLALLARRENSDADYDLFIARRPDTARAWGQVEALAELNSDAGETDAFLLPDERTLLFTRDEDLVLATRAAADRPFGDAVALHELNSDDDDRDAWATPELDYVVFASDRGGSYALYEAARVGKLGDPSRF